MKTLVNVLITLSISHIISFFTGISVYVLIPITVIINSIVETIVRNYKINKFNKQIEKTFGVELTRVK